MADFGTAFRKTSAFEGGYVDNPHDRGGETYRGIARKCFQSWDGWAYIDEAKANGLCGGALDAHLLKNSSLQMLVHLFYKNEFWNGTNSDKIPSQEVAEFLFDASVNHGRTHPAEWLQRSLNCLNGRGGFFHNLVVDGKVGPSTISAVGILVARGEVHYLMKAMNVIRGAFYISITDRDESQECFIRGWLNRVSIK